MIGVGWTSSVDCAQHTESNETVNSVQVVEGERERICIRCYLFSHSADTVVCLLWVWLCAKGRYKERGQEKILGAQA